MYEEKIREILIRKFESQGLSNEEAQEIMQQMEDDKAINIGVISLQIVQAINNGSTLENQLSMFEQGVNSGM